MSEFQMKDGLVLVSGGVGRCGKSSVIADLLAIRPANGETDFTFDDPIIEFRVGAASHPDGRMP